MKWLKWLKWIPVAGEVMNAVAMLRMYFSQPWPTVASEVRKAIDGSLKSIEAAAGVDLPNELVDQLIEANLKIIQEYQEKRG